MSEADAISSRVRRASRVVCYANDLANGGCDTAARQMIWLRAVREVVARRSVEAEWKAPMGHPYMVFVQPSTYAVVVHYVGGRANPSRAGTGDSLVRFAKLMILLRAVDDAVYRRSKAVKCCTEGTSPPEIHTTINVHSGKPLCRRPSKSK
jgi:hypothetical protein